MIGDRPGRAFGACPRQRYWGRMTEAFLDNLEQVPPKARGGVLTIGNFDGVHLGHQKLLNSARALADAHQASVAAVTFDPPPELVLRPESIPEQLVPAWRKCELLAEHGADYVVQLRTDEAMLAMSPDEFIERIIVCSFTPRYVVEGPNFFFGLARSGNVGTLRAAGRREGFAVEVVEPARIDVNGETERISSTLIRGLVQAGNVRDAARCLGRPFCLYGTVVPGEGQGKHLEFPTTNLDFGPQVLPADGVYAGIGTIGEQSWPAAISVGDKPTFASADWTVEAYLIGADGNFYGREMQLEFLQWLRTQQKFAGLSQLKGQLAKDVQRVQDTFSRRT